MVQRKGRQLSLYVPDEMAERLKAISERTMITQSRLVRRALELLFQEYPEPQPSKSSSKARK
jgi:predicted DNA-binding protein